MKFVDGWWVTDTMSGPGAFLNRSTGSEIALRETNSRLSVAIQAGGHIGLYPIMLAHSFKRVYTFEPDRNNFECLVANTNRIQGIGEIFPARGVLGNIRGTVGINKHKNSGGHTVEGEGAFPLYRIDDLGLDDCALIHLDVEGYELHALRGALKTIRAYKPVIVAEENKQLLKHGFKYGDIERLLAPFGYKMVRRIDEDIILECA